MKAIILTGSNGYIGKKVLTFFEKKKIRIFCLQRKIPKKKNKNCVYFTYKNIEKIKKNNIELLIHLAAADPENTRENNIIKQNSDIDKIIVKLKFFLVHLIQFFLIIRKTKFFNQLYLLP